MVGSQKFVKDIHMMEKGRFMFLRGSVVSKNFRLNLLKAKLEFLKKVCTGTYTSFISVTMPYPIPILIRPYL